MINTVKIIDNGFLVNDLLSVPNDPDNRHFQEVQEWIADGNTPDPADPPPVPPTAQQVFDSRIDDDSVLKALVDELESANPGFRGRAKARV